MIKSLSDWLRTFDKMTFTGSTVDVPNEIILQAMTERLIKVTAGSTTVKLTTKGIRSKFNDKRVALSLLEREMVVKMCNTMLDIKSLSKSDRINIEIIKGKVNI